MTNIKPITVDNIDEAIEWLKTLEKCPQQRNALRVLDTLKEHPDGFVVWMNKRNWKKYVKLVLNRR